MAVSLSFISSMGQGNSQRILSLPRLQDGRRPYGGNTALDVFLRRIKEASTSRRPSPELEEPAADVEIPVTQAHVPTHRRSTGQDELIDYEDIQLPHEYLETATHEHSRITLPPLGKVSATGAYEDPSQTWTLTTSRATFRGRSEHGPSAAADTSTYYFAYIH